MGQIEQNGLNELNGQSSQNGLNGQSSQNGQNELNRLNDGLMYDMYLKMGISPEVYEYSRRVLKSLEERFEAIDRMAEFNQLKVLDAMRRERVSESCLYGTTGYGYNDLGRDTLERVYARLFHGEDALVRPQITCGTHALCVALFSLLRPGDELLSAAGKPYDTLEEVIGIRPSEGSLSEYGVTYSQAELDSSGHMDIGAVRAALKPCTKLVTIQRSKGYQSRPSFSVEEIGRVVRSVKDVRPDVMVMVDNCYGEFVEEREPLEAGADLIVGSLIKNPGGGLAPAGGYIAGRKECVEKAARRLTSPGLGKEVGASLGVLPQFYQGLFLSPVVSASALKGAVFAASLFEGLGYKCVPGADEERHDIIQAVELGSEKALKAFCGGIQAASPVDSHVTPEPWPMPGYDCDVIMAAGSFVSGSSIELSADAPVKPPYNVYFQGGLTWPHAKFGMINALDRLFREGIVKP